MYTYWDSLRTFTARIAVILLAIGTVFSPEQALAVSTWNPTLLVNTEAFQEIDDGDGTTNIELRFGSSTQTIKFLTTLKFQFSHAISVLGTISGSSLNVDRNATVGGTFAVSGSSVIVGNETVKGTLSGARLRVSAGGADIQGALNASGAIRGDNNLTINDDQTAADAVFTFGSDGTNETLTFLNTADKFQFSDDVSVVGYLSGSALRVDGLTELQGALTVSGAIRGDNNLTINDDQTAADAVFTFGSDGTNETLTFLNTADKFQFSDDVSVVGYLSGSILRVDGNADIHGALNASGSIRTDGDITAGADDAATDVIFTFMNSGTDETLTWLDTADKFQFSDDISVLGNISGSSLTVDGSASISGTLIVKTAITSKGSLSGATFYGAGLGTCTNASQALQYNITTGRFSCATITASVNNGSGGILSLHPEYPNAIYFASGSAMVGQLTMSGGTSALDNSYVWTSSRTDIQNYWISVRVRVPDNFSSWDPTKPIELRYKTGSGTATVNHVTTRMRDTAGALVTLTSGAGLANTSWTTANIKGPEAMGTFTAKGYFTVYIKLATTNASTPAVWGTANAAVGFLNLNFETTTP